MADGEELELARASARGDERSIRALEARYFPDVERALLKMGLAKDAAAEAMQALRKHLFVGATPQIASYSGRGDLAGWLRVTATRLAWKQQKKHRREVPIDAIDPRALEPSRTDPELGYMKEGYRAAFATAFREALEALDPKDKLLLKQHLLDALTIDDLAALHGVHRATTARWLTRAKDDLLASTRARFAERAGLSKRECESVLRLVQSRLDVTLRTLAV